MVELKVEAKVRAAEAVVDVADAQEVRLVAEALRGEAARVEVTGTCRRPGCTPRK